MKNKSTNVICLRVQDGSDHSQCVLWKLFIEKRGHFGGSRRNSQVRWNTMVILAEFRENSKFSFLSLNLSLIVIFESKSEKW